MNSELFQTAYQYQQSNQLQKALSLYEELLTNQPEHCEALHFAGLAYAELKDYDKAITYLTKALAHGSQDPRIHNNIANIYKSINKLEKALHHYQMAIKINPQYAQAHNNLANIYTSQNQFQKALTHYVKAVHAEPHSAPLHHNLGLLLLKKGQILEASKQFQNVITLHPEHLDAHFYLGVIQLSQGDTEKAKSCFENVLGIDGEHVEALTNIGVVELKHDNPQKAIDYFTKALSLDNYHIEARNNLAATFIHHDRFENALMHYDILVQAYPDNIEYRYNSGVAEMSLGHLEKAQSHFQHILSIDPKHFESLTNLAAIFIRLEEKDEALALLEQAKIINPDDTATQFMLNALTGDTTNPVSNTEYIKNLFDNYALNYDKHMQDTLHYALPQKFGQLLHELELLQVEHALDLGCGTGLSGIILKEISKHLTGVDLSPKMLAIAKEKGLFDELIQSDIQHYLKSTQQSFEVILAADVIPYIENLQTLLQLVARRLNSKGYFLFSHEISAHEDYILQKSARFAHHPNMVKKALLKAGLDIIKQEKITGRMQNNQALSVMVYAVKKA